MNLTSIVGKLFVPRQKELERHFTDGEQLQKQVLNRLLAQGAHTEYGRKYDFANIHSYEEFTRLVPQTAYEELAPWIDRMRHGERNVLWPGLVTWFAKSSGTTNDKSKFIPVTREGLKNIHYRGSKDAVAFYFENNPKSSMFDGKALILGGSHQPNYNVAHSLVGDLSAILI
jgi:hypothetical protein